MYSSTFIRRFLYIGWVIGCVAEEAPLLTVDSAEPEPEPVQQERPAREDTPIFALCTETGPSTLGMLSYQADISPIFAMCADCHANTPTSLQFADGYGAMYNVASEGLPSMVRIAGGSPQQSYVWHKLCGTHHGIGGSGTTMPKKTVLTEAEMEAIRSWIVGGALP